MHYITPSLPPLPLPVQSVALELSGQDAAHLARLLAHVSHRLTRELVDAEGEAAELLALTQRLNTLTLPAMPYTIEDMLREGRY